MPEQVNNKIEPSEKKASSFIRTTSLGSCAAVGGYVGLLGGPFGVIIGIGIGGMIGAAIGLSIIDKENNEKENLQDSKQADHDGLSNSQLEEKGEDEMTTYVQDKETLEDFYDSAYQDKLEMEKYNYKKLNILS